MSRRSFMLIALGLAFGLTSAADFGGAAVPAEAHPSTAPIVREMKDFDGDGLADFAVWRPSTGVWHIRGQAPVRWGQQGDIPLADHYDHDGVIDLAVWRPSTGVWWIRATEDGTKTVTIRFGQSGDVPMPGDYSCDNPGHAIPAVWRPSTGVWWIQRGRTLCRTQWGRPGDIPNRGGYGLGDNSCGLGPAYSVWRPRTGTFHVYTNRLERLRVQLGRPGDIPMPRASYGHADCHLPDMAQVWRPLNGTWYSEYNLKGVRYGREGDVPVPGYFRPPPEEDGEGYPEWERDIAVWRPSNGVWYVRGLGQIRWGRAGDIPV